MPSSLRYINILVAGSDGYNLTCRLNCEDIWCLGDLKGSEKPEMYYHINHLRGGGGQTFLEPLSIMS